MVYQSPTNYIGALRTQLAACAAWTTAVGAGNETARIHFPVSNPTVDALPHAVLVQLDGNLTRYAEGASGLASGLLEVDLYVGATTNGGTPYLAGDLETLADNLIQQLLFQTQVIPFAGTSSRTMARDPTVGSFPTDDVSAPAAYRTITLRLPFGLFAA
jgi:hypothetical protein